MLRTLESNIDSEIKQWQSKAEQAYEELQQVAVKCTDYIAEKYDHEWVHIFVGPEHHE